MNCFLVSLVSLCPLLLALCAQSVSSRNVSETYLQKASFPPRGWNSYDSFGWTVSEEEFLQNAGIVSRSLKAHGYKYVVVDYLWYRKNVQGANSNSLGFDVIDEWGRMIPDPGRWPSSTGGKGFSEVANKVHNMGLMFGIHVMRGISTQAVNANTPILDTTKAEYGATLHHNLNFLAVSFLLQLLRGGAYQESGRVWHAKDIALPGRACAWMSHGFMSVNTQLGAGRAFLRSLYEQYAAWGVDFVKHDCVFGADLDLNEITYVSGVLRELNHPIVYSLSPGTSVTPALAKDVSGLVNMYRITGDDWDNWDDVKSHFDISRDLAAASMIGAKGLNGNSWPDLDMLPFGWLTDPGSNQGPHRFSKLNLEEKRTQMTLWSMAKSPLMYGGDLRSIDIVTYSLITNPILLEINSFSSSNREFPGITSSENLNHKDHHLRVKKRRSKRGGKPSYTHALSLIGCSETKARGWSVESLNEDLERICWKRSLENQLQPPFCVHKREFQFKLDGESTHQEDYRGKHHLVATNEMKFCLDASPKQKLTSKEFKSGTFSPCRWDANQMWKLNPNGTMVNSYSGLCAIAESAKDGISPGGIRSWIAKGRRGEVYVAFFNLSEQKTVISTKTSSLGNAFGDRTSITSCHGTEVWSGKQVITTQGTLSAEVGLHGCALFVLNCH